MGALEDNIQRTLVQALIDGGHAEIAGIVIDGTVKILLDPYNATKPVGISLDLPPKTFAPGTSSENFQEDLKSAVRLVLAGNLRDAQNNPVENPVIEIKMKLLEATGDWKEQARQSIAAKTAQPADAGKSAKPADKSKDKK